MASARTRRVLGQPIPQKAQEVGRVELTDGKVIAYRWYGNESRKGAICTITPSMTKRERKTSEAAWRAYFDAVREELRAGLATGRVTNITGCFAAEVA